MCLPSDGLAPASAAGHRDARHNGFMRARMLSGAVLAVFSPAAVCPSVPKGSVVALVTVTLIQSQASLQTASSSGASFSSYYVVAERTQTDTMTRLVGGSRQPEPEATRTLFRHVFATRGIDWHWQAGDAKILKRHCGMQTPS